MFCIYDRYMIVSEYSPILSLFRKILEKSWIIWVLPINKCCVCGKFINTFLSSLLKVSDKCHAIWNSVFITFHFPKWLINHWKSFLSCVKNSFSSLNGSLPHWQFVKEFQIKFWIIYFYLNYLVISYLRNPCESKKYDKY